MTETIRTTRPSWQGALSGIRRRATHGVRTRSPQRLAQTLDICRNLDLLVVLCAVFGVFLATNRDYPGSSSLTSFLELRVSVKNALLLASLILVMQVTLRVFRLYDPRWFADPVGYMLRLGLAGSVGMWPLAFFPLASKSGSFRFSTALWGVAASIVALMVVRIVIWLESGATPAGAADHQVLIVGSGDRALKLYHEINSQNDNRAEIAGFVDTLPHKGRPLADPVSQRMLGSLEDLETILRHRVIDDVFIALPIKSHYTEIQSTLQLCERLGIRAAYLADVFSTNIARPAFEEDGAFSLMRLHIAPDDARLLVKRAIDIVIALVGLLLTLPLLLAIAFLVKVTSPGPVIFSQERYGFNKRKFRMHKFRTMVAGAEALQAMLENSNEASGPVFKIRNDPRMTSVGRILRKTSLDELPQLVNVLRGDMSLVGPRPLPLRDVHRFEESWLMRRFSIRPGITGTWQVSGRSNLDFEQWVRLDLEYIDRWSLWLDFKTLVLTVPAVLKGRGAA